MRHIYLVQVNNRFGANTFLPYSVGLIWSYCRTVGEIVKNYRLKGFLYLRDPIETTVARLDNPDVIAVSCYVWNWEYSKAFAKAVRERFADCLIVMGGPQVPNRSETFFRDHPYVDMLVHFEGEHAFGEILLERLKSKPDFAAIPGLSIQSNDRSTTKTPPRARVVDVDSLPSPYLNGVFDDLMTAPYDFHASQETHRGCPFSCTFCDWGSAVFTKVRAFSDERVLAEIDWFARHKIELLYNCDANFGLLKRDEDLADALVEAKERYGYPKKFRAAYAKNTDQRIFRIAKTLNEMEMSKGITLSLQSQRKETLEIIKRKNIGSGDLSGLMKQFRDSRIVTYTELIMGLPGETYDSFVDGLTDLMKCGQHEGLFVYLCMVLPNSEMADPGYVKHHGIKVSRMPAMTQHAAPSKDGIREFHDIVVETRTMSLGDWRKVYLFAWVAQAFHSMGLLQYVAIFLATRLKIPYRLFYESLLAFAEDHPETLIGKEYKSIVAVLDGALRGGTWDIVIPEFGEICWPPEEATFLRTVVEKDKFYAEIEDFIVTLLAAENTEVQPDLLASLLTYQRHMIRDPVNPDQFEFKLRHDIHAYFDNPDSIGEDALNRDAIVRIHATPAFDNDLPHFAQHVVWYGRKGGLFRHSEVEVS